MAFSEAVKRLVHATAEAFGAEPPSNPAFVRAFQARGQGRDAEAVGMLAKAHMTPTNSADWMFSTGVLLDVGERSGDATLVRHAVVMSFMRTDIPLTPERCDKAIDALQRIDYEHGLPELSDDARDLALIFDRIRTGEEKRPLREAVADDIHLSSYTPGTPANYQYLTGLSRELAATPASPFDGSPS